ncbi:MAG: hypothetical protein GW817_09540, partial [Flavobacteriales bacterium]|nr:hypothetical protein [Flavobacteriales bacterium]
VHFHPLWVVHFHPPRYAHFNPLWVVYYVRFLHLSIAITIFVVITYKGEIDLIIVGLLVISIGMVFYIFILKNLIEIQKRQNKYLKIALDSDIEILKSAYNVDEEILKKLYNNDSELLKFLLDKINKADEPKKDENGSKSE